MEGCQIDSSSLGRTLHLMTALAICSVAKISLPSCVRLSGTPGELQRYAPNVDKGRTRQS